MAKLLPKGDKKLLHAWAFYDWANSVYSLVIASAVFPIFYDAIFSLKGIETLTVFGAEWKSSSLIFGTTAVAFSIVALISPLLSGVADFLGNKKFFLKFFCYLGAASTMGLYFFNIDHIYIGPVSYTHLTLPTILLV